MFDRLIPGFCKADEERDVLAHLARDMQPVRNARIALHLSADFIDSPYQATMWARHLDDSGVGWYVICRDRQHVDTMRKAGVRCVWAPKPHHLIQAMGPEVRAVLYVNNAARNLEMLRRFPDLVHVQMLHGDSDKPPSYSPVTANFDRVFVAGQLGQDRYALNGVTIPTEAFVHVGRPQVRDRPVGLRPGWQQAPVIAYMPTWIGGRSEVMFSSLDRGADILRSIRRASPDATILFKPHPLSYKDPSWTVIEQDLRRAMTETGTEAIDRADDAGLVYDRSDVLVTDISSTMSDFLYSDRPLAVILPRRPLQHQDRAFPTLSACYRIAGDLGDIEARLGDVLGADSLAGARAAMRRYAFGSDDRPGDARFIEAIRHLAGAGA